MLQIIPIDTKTKEKLSTVGRDVRYLLNFFIKVCVDKDLHSRVTDKKKGFLTVTFESRVEFSFGFLSDTLSLVCFYFVVYLFKTASFIIEVNNGYL